MRMPLEDNLEQLLVRRLGDLAELRTDHAENSFARLIVRADVIQRGRKLRADNLLANASVEGEDLANHTQSALPRWSGRWTPGCWT
jgi:hypothetical protein